jgi:L-aspartate oxidase
VQGANRLASNSVTEAVIAGRRTGAAIVGALRKAAGDAARSPSPADILHHAERWRVSRAGTTAPQGMPTGARTRTRRLALAQDMSRYAGVLRDGDRLTKLIRVIGAAVVPATGSRVPATAGTMAGCGQAAGVMRPVGFGLDLEAVEAANLRTVSLLIAAGARRRAESRGCHRRRDAAGTAAAPWHTLARWDGRELVLTEEAL